MKNRKMLLWFSVFSVLGIIIFLLCTGPLLQNPEDPTLQRIKHRQTFGDFPNQITSKTYKLQQPVDAWAAWIDEQVEVQTEVFLEMLKIERPYDLASAEAQIDHIKAQIRGAFEREADKLKKNSTDPPSIRVFDFSELEPPENQEETGPKKHDGPQTVEALLESFEDMAVHPEVDMKYPQAEWVQMLLNRGIVIEDFTDYSGFLAARANLEYLEKNPEIWKSGHAGIPPTENWETFKAAFIDRKIWQYQQIKAAEEADPDITGGVFTGDDYRTFLPFKPGRVYVTKVEGGGIFRGASLTQEQKFNILFRGIHPDKYDIVYIDENNTILSEPPAAITQEEIGIANRNQIEESLPTGDLFPQMHQVDNDFVSRDKTQEDIFDETQKFAEKVRGVQQGKEKAFLEFLEKVARGDVELEAELEKLLVPELPKLPMDERIKTSLPKRFSPQRFERAIATLRQYGAKDGLRRLRKTDSEVAAYLERTLQSPQSVLEFQRGKD